MRIQAYDFGREPKVVARSPIQPSQNFKVGEEGEAAASVQGAETYMQGGCAGQLVQATLPAPSHKESGAELMAGAAVDKPPLIEVKALNPFPQIQNIDSPSGLKDNRVVIYSSAGHGNGPLAMMESEGAVQYGVSPDSRFQSGVNPESRFQSGVNPDSRFQSGVNPDSRFQHGASSEARFYST